MIPPQMTIGHRTVYSVTLLQSRNIYNIFGNTFQSGSVKPKKPQKKAQASKAEGKRDKHREWKDRGDACLLFTEDNRIKFHYQDEETDLCLKHSGPVYEFLMELKDGECPRDVLETNEKIGLTRKGTKRSFTDVTRRTNEHLNDKVAAKVKTKGFADIPDNIKFVGYDEQKKVYRFYIPIQHADKID